MVISFFSSITFFTRPLAAVRILQPGPACKTFVIQNNGAVNVRLSIDGSTDTKKTPPPAEADDGV